MAKLGMTFKVRRWSDVDALPFDVVALDHDNNKQHYQPDSAFSTEAAAQKHCNTLSARIVTNPEAKKFIQDHWPIDGAVE